MQSYGQFCPVAKALEVTGTRWTLLVLRELIGGAHRFNDLQRGVPLMSRALLAQRLRELEAAGLISSSEKSSGHGRDYTLTEAGRALQPVIEALGNWGQFHAHATISQDDCDPSLLFWALRKHTDPARLPEHRFVMQFILRNLPRGRRSAERWWLVAIAGEPLDICPKDPGFPVDVALNADVSALVKVWLGYRGLGDAIRNGEIGVEGSLSSQKTLLRLLDLRDSPCTKQWAYGPSS